MKVVRWGNYGKASAATTGVANLVDTLWKPDFCPGTKRTGGLTQISEYTRDMGSAQADPHVLFIYWAGSNDIFNATADNVDQRIENARKNMEIGLTQLAAEGAKRILVASRTARPALDSENNQFGIRLNKYELN